MAVDRKLPPPGPNQKEILFRRLLLQCEKHLNRRNSQELGEDWQRNLKLHSYVEYLKELLYDLENGKDSLSPDVLEQYRAHVKAVAGELRPPSIPAYCRRVAAQDWSKATASNTPGAAAKASSALASARNLQLQQQQRQGTADQSDAAASKSPSSRRDTAAAAAAAAGGGQTEVEGRRPAFNLSKEAQSRLATQAALQAELGEELLGMTAELKAGALAMQSAIRQRGAILDEAETALVSSTANAQQVAGQAKTQYKTSRMGFCQTCLIMLAVALIFSGMLVYIRLTAIVGWTGR